MPATQPQMGKENETAGARPSKFKEAAMNSTSSIHPPPDMLWSDLGIEHLIDNFNEENSKPAVHAHRRARSKHGEPSVARLTSASRSASASSGPPAAGTPASGPLGRFSRAVASFFAGSAFSALGKRKAGSENAEKGTEKTAGAGEEDRRAKAEAAYKEAKEAGLLPTPKVYVRPRRKPVPNGHATNQDVPESPTPSSTSTSLALSTLKTPTPLHKSPSKKDLHKQKKLSKRVSDLEHKLAEARRELQATLNAPPVPPLPTEIPPTPNSSHFWTESEVSPHNCAESSSKSVKTGKIVKKRKAESVIDGGGGEEFKAIATDSDVSLDPASPRKKIKKSRRLAKKRSTATMKEEVVIVVPDGVSVPPIPSLPKGIEGKRVAVSDDGFGGFGSEIF